MKKLILLSLWASWLYEQPTPEVRVSNGMLRGSVAHSGYRKYLGIPYAYTNRENYFKAPLPEPTWEGVFNAVDENVRCIQWMTHSSIIGQEDCLRLNIYTPLEVKKPLPVMVFIHGGGFYEGSGSSAILGPEYLVDKNVILVTFNYRLNIPGFLCLGTKEAPGNAGMKDQVAALKWIQKNILAFGGDKDNVMIFGESAGGSSVSFHLLSPMSKGLFHKALIQSGSSLSSWSLQRDPVKTASKLAESLGYKTDDPDILYQIFSNKTNEELILTRVPREKGNILVSEILFVPCVEKEIEGVQRFLSDTPYNLLLRGDFNKVPIVLGTTTEEGFLFTSAENDTSLNEFKFEKSMPLDLVFPTEDEKLSVANQIENLYMEGENLTSDTLVKLSRLYGEPHFMYPVLAETNLYLKANATVFNYIFDYDGHLNLLKKFTKFKEYPGATHADDLFYIFKPNLYPTPLRYLERNIVDIMTTMWTNFAKYGFCMEMDYWSCALMFRNPSQESDDLSVKWIPTDKEHKLGIKFNEKNISMQPLWSKKSLEIWDDIYSKYRWNK